jgi:hypothetical protein
MENLGFEPGAAHSHELRTLIDQALVASDAAGESLVSCYLQMALDMLDGPVVGEVISDRMQ